MTASKNSVVVPTELFRPISLVFYIARIAGFFPASFAKKPAGYHLAWSRKLLAYSYVFTIVIAGVAFYGQCQIYQIQEMADMRFSQTSGTICTYLEIGLLFVTFLLGTFLTPPYFKHLWSYLKFMTKVDLLIGAPRQKLNRCTVVTIITLSISAAVLVLDIILWTRVLCKHMSFLQYFGNIIAFYITYFYIMVREVYFWTLVDAIGTRLISVNEILSKILRAKEAQQILSNANENARNNLSKLVNTNKVYKPPFSVKSDVDDERITEKVKQLISVHNLLFEASGSVNHHLGIFTLVLLVGCLIHLLVTPYDLYLQINGTKEYAFVGSQLMWMLGHILRLIFIIEPCHGCKCQVQQMSALIYKILPLEHCQDTKYQLKTLLKQMEQCPVKFDAAALTDIDRTLLTTVTGTVTTYLVILFQFNN